MAKAPSHIGGSRTAERKLSWHALSPRRISRRPRRTGPRRPVAGFPQQGNGIISRRRAAPRLVPAVPQIIRYMRIELPRGGALSPDTPDLIFRATRPSGWNGSREMIDKTQDQQFRTAAAKRPTRMSGDRLKGRRSPWTEP